MQVVTGYFNDRTVPIDSGALAAFRAHSLSRAQRRIDIWRRTLRRRSQNDASIPSLRSE